jgi:hypothetical protein
MLIFEETQQNVDVKECSGTIYRYRQSSAFVDGRVVKREEVYPLKRMSCNGKCGTPYCLYEEAVLKDYIDDTGQFPDVDIYVKDFDTVKLQINTIRSLDWFGVPDEDHELKFVKYVEKKHDRT